MVSEWCPSTYSGGGFNLHVSKKVESKEEVNEEEQDVMKNVEIQV
jgi:hypothetical protein